MPSVFRKKSIDKISSPEDLHAYIHATNPGLWMLIVSVIVLLGGVIVWGAIGTVETRTGCSVWTKTPEETHDRQNVIMYIPYDAYEGVFNYLKENDHTITLCYKNDNYTITDCTVNGEATMVSLPDEHDKEDYKDKAVLLLGVPNYELIYILKGTCENITPDMEFNAELLLEKIHPLTFVFN